MNFLKITALITLSLSFLVGCDSSSSSPSTPTPANGSLEGPTTGDETLYRPALLSLIPGSYSGVCVTYPDNAPTTASVVISNEGLVTAPGASGALLDYQVTFTFMRNFKDGTPITGSFATADLRNSSGLNLVLRAADNDVANSVSARQGVGSVPGIFCASSPQTAVLKTKSLHGAIGKFLLTPKKTISCTSNNVAKPLDLTISNDSAQIGDENFSFTTGLRQEMAGIIADVNNLVYVMKTEDSREFSMTLDKKGALSLLHFKDKLGVSTNCVP